MIKFMKFVSADRGWLQTSCTSCVFDFRPRGHDSIPSKIPTIGEGTCNSGNPNQTQLNLLSYVFV